MDHQPEEFEQYLREFEPRRPRPLPARQDSWKMKSMVAVAAIVMVCVGAWWLTSRKPGATTQNGARVPAQDQLAQQAPLPPQDRARLAPERPDEVEGARKTGTTAENDPRVPARNQPAPEVRFSRQDLTRLALEKPDQFERALTAASRNILPRFDSNDSTLRALAKE